MKIDLSYDAVKSLYDEACYPLHDGINPFAIRNSLWLPDKFNDVIGILHGKEVLAFSGTTKPGKHWLISDDGHKDGVFILQHGYFENCWHRGLHKGKYKALVQFGNAFRGWRDNDLDGNFDASGPTWTNVKGLNLHTTRWDKQVKSVGEFSAGCVVVEVATEYDQLIDEIYASEQFLFNFAMFKEAA